MTNVDLESGRPGSSSAHPVSAAAHEVRACQSATGSGRRPAMPNLDGAYAGSFKISGVVGGEPVQHARFDGGDFLVQDIVVPGMAHIDAEPAAGALVIQVVSGRVRYSASDAEDELDVGQPVLAGDGLPCALDVEHARVRLTVLDRPLLRRVAAEQPGSTVAQIQFYAARTPTKAKEEMWNRAVRFVTDSVSEVDATSRALVTDACARLLAASALTCFPNSVTDDSGSARAGADTPIQLRRAMSFVDASVQEDIGVNDIAAAVHLSPRAVQYLFRRHLGLAPSQYVRNVRLDRAHQDLVGSDRSTVTVSEVAARWGFGHTGRFAVLYRQTFGQSPHVTLRD